MPKIKFTQFLPTQTTKIVDRRTALNEKHIRITKSLLTSPAYRSLSANGLLLYQMLELRFHKEEETNTDFALSQTLATYLIGLNENSKASGKRAISQLCHKGFIEPTYISKGGGKNKKIPNRYKFSSNWKQIK